MPFDPYFVRIGKGSVPKKQKAKDLSHDSVIGIEKTVSLKFARTIVEFKIYFAFPNGKLK
jgi:hypothetical protein